MDEEQQYQVYSFSSDSDDSTVDRLKTCKMYMKHDISLIVVLCVQMVALSIAYYLLIKKNKIKVKPWTRIVICVQLLGLLTIVSLDVYGMLFKQDQKYYFYLVSSITTSLFNTIEFCYMFFGFKMMILEAQLPVGDMTLEQIYKKVMIRIKFAKVLTIAFILYLTSKWMVNLVLRKLFP